jgi:3-oxoacyl-[acyl-carrier-protein] synthase II
VKEVATDGVFSKKEARYVDPFISYAVLAALEASEGAGILSGKPALQCGVILGSSRGGITSIERELTRISGKGNSRVSPFLMPVSTTGAAAAYIGSRLGMSGYMLGVSTACASGANAIGEAFRMIRTGGASLMLAGGSEAPICRLCIEGYGSAGALSTSDPAYASRPFDINRDGFVLAEGACVLVLEELGHAVGRGAHIHAELRGYGNVCDPASLTLPSVGGEVRAIAAALAEAGISADDVDYAHAHGTSTPAGDRAEALALKAVFGDRAVRVTAVKSMTGHMLAASGAFETACAAMGLEEGVIPPTVNTRDIDPDSCVNPVRRATADELRICVVNSFGFGGVNTALVVKRFEG